MSDAVTDRVWRWVRIALFVAWFWAVGRSRDSLFDPTRYQGWDIVGALGLTLVAFLPWLAWICVSAVVTDRMGRRITAYAVVVVVTAAVLWCCGVGWLGLAAYFVAVTVAGVLWLAFRAWKALIDQGYSGANISSGPRSRTVEGIDLV